MRSLRTLDLPIKIQVLALTLAAILVAQALTVVVVLILPPPRFQPYRLDDIAEALAGRSTGVSADRRLRVREMRNPPEDIGDAGRVDRVLGAALAERLGADESDVRLGVRPRVRGFAMVRLAGYPPPVGRGSLTDRRIGFAGDLQPEPRRVVRLLEFVAAWRQPNGVWRVVESPPTHEWIKRLLIWVLAGMAVMGPVAWWFADKITRPVRSFAAAAEKLGRDPTAAAPAPVREGPAEIGIAARAFNDMQTRLVRYVADRVGMMGAISHDLRTPLTRIRFKIEGVPEPVRSDILWDVQHMEAMIDLVLAFIHDLDHAAPRERLDLASLVSAAVDDAVALGRQVVMDDPAELLLVEASPVRLRNVLDNLLDNAVKYGERGHLRVFRRGDDAVVAIQDSGPGIPPDQLERVFAPFYRLAQFDADIPGVGLGLTTARSVVRGLGGDILLTPSPNGLLAEIVLPIAPDV